jgi:diguanylate cyclase (GGDEF)-like protein
MRNILLIDKGESSVHNFKKSLTRKGCSLLFAQTIGDALTHLKDGSIDLITIGKSFSSKICTSTPFTRLSADVPKIFLIDNRIPQKSISLKDRHWASLCEPVSLKEYTFWTDKLIKGKALEDENLKLRSQLSRRQKELRFYDDIIKIFASAGAIKKNLNAILKKTQKMIDAESCSLLFNDEPLFEIIKLSTSKSIQRFSFNKKISIAGSVMKQGEPEIVHNALTDRRFNKKADFLPRMKAASLLCAPLRIKDRIVGVLRIMNKKGDGIFTEDDMNILVNTAHYTALAIERAFLHEKLKNDELTNLFNARHLSQVIEMETIRAHRYNSAFSLIFMDMDNFKNINDMHGHLVGSRTLVEIARILQENLRKIDVIARYGGDEFVIILPQTPGEGGFLVAERIRELIEKHVFLKQEGLSLRLTASLGVASFPRDAQSRDDLLRLADDAMYRGKFATKNSVYAAK